MKKIFLFIVGISAALNIFAQPEPTPQETARNFMRSGDWDNAIIVLKGALQKDPGNLELLKDLAFSYTYKRDFAKAMETVKPLLDRDDIDVQTYQIAGNVYKALAEIKDADKMYKKALKKFPDSGPLYSEYGELFWDKREESLAIEQWERGIKADPAYAGNYYNASTYYFFAKDKVWTLIYGEIFVNMEYLTERATEVKKMLLSTYKEKLFSDIDSKDALKSDFAKAVLQTYNKLSSLTNRGITIETLNMIRTRFILDWFANHANKFPFKLFDYQQQLIKEGMFEAYNQWLFGPVDNLSSFDQWTKTNSETYTRFTNFQKGRIFKMPQGQYYAAEKK